MLDYSLEICYLPFGRSAHQVKKHKKFNTRPFKFYYTSSDVGYPFYTIEFGSVSGKIMDA